MLPDGSRITSMVLGIFPGLDLYYTRTDLAQHVMPACLDLDYLDHDLSNV